MEEAVCAPSSNGDLDSYTELLLRNYGCELIQKAGILLQLNAVTIASGQTILHHYYFKRSLRDLDIRAGAASSCFLATKLVENIRKAKDVARVFDFLINNEQQDHHGPIVHIDEILYKDIMRVERDILVEFGFHLDSLVICPHRYVLQYVFALFRNLKEYSDYDVNDVAQRSWCYLNDSMRTTLCCKLSPGVIAAGCIYMAATSLGIPLRKEEQWYIVFNARWSDIILVRDELEHLYKMGKPHYVNVTGRPYAPETPSPGYVVGDKAVPTQPTEIYDICESRPPAFKSHKDKGSSESAPVGDHDSPRSGRRADSGSTQSGIHRINDDRRRHYDQSRHRVGRESSKHGRSYHRRDDDHRSHYRRSRSRENRHRG